MDNRLQFSTGWTPTPTKYCIRCQRIHESARMLCEVCEEGDRLSALFEHDNELLRDGKKEIFDDDEDDRRADADRQDLISSAREGY
jgi:hypothetical protein